MVYASRYLQTVTLSGDGGLAMLLGDLLTFVRVEDSGGVDAALTEAFAHDGPALVDVVSDPQELTIPPALALEQAKGFALYCLKTVLCGRGDELFDLARTNLRQVF